MFMYILPACMLVYTMHASCLQRPEEGVRCPGTGIIDGCACHVNAEESNTAPLEEPVFLAALLQLRLK